MTQLNPKDQYAHLCTVTGCQVNSQLMKDLPDTVEGLGVLRKLDFSRSMLGRNDVEPLVRAILRHCSGLLVLNLSQNYLTDDCVIPICETLVEYSPLLVSLNMSNNPLSNKTGRYLLRFMEGMPALKSVGVQKTLMNDDMLRRLAKPFSKVIPSTLSHLPGTYSFSTNMSSSSSLRFPSENSAICFNESSTRDAACNPVKTQWPALKTLWRAAAVAAPRNDDYFSLSILISLARDDQQDTDKYHNSTSST